MPHLLLQSLLISCVDVMATSFQLSITNNTLYSRGAYMYATDWSGVQCFRLFTGQGVSIVQILERRAHQLIELDRFIAVNKVIAYTLYMTFFSNSYD